MKSISLKTFIAITLGILFMTTAALAQKKVDRVETNETAMRKYFDEGKHDEIEGIYKNYSGQYYKLAIKKQDYY